MTQLEHWGCPWSRDADGHVAVRPFGGMKIERTWFAADKTGFHMLHALFQTSQKYNNVTRYDEWFVTRLLVDEGRVQGVAALELRTGQIRAIAGKATILSTGGAGRIFPFTTNAAIKSEDGIMVNKDGYRYLQDYNLGQPLDIHDPKHPQKATMELGPRDRLSQAFLKEVDKGRTIKLETPSGIVDVVHLDVRHLGEKKINKKIPFVRELAKNYVGIDPVYQPIPVRPVVHY